MLAHFAYHTPLDMVLFEEASIVRSNVDPGELQGVILNQAAPSQLVLNSHVSRFTMSKSTGCCSLGVTLPMHFGA